MNRAVNRAAESIGLSIRAVCHFPFVRLCIALTMGRNPRMEPPTHFQQTSSSLSKLVAGTQLHAHPLWAFSPEPQALVNHIDRQLHTRTLALIRHPLFETCSHRHTDGIVTAAILRFRYSPIPHYLIRLHDIRDYNSSPYALSSLQSSRDL